PARRARYAPLRRDAPLPSSRTSLSSLPSALVQVEGAHLYRTPPRARKTSSECDCLIGVGRLDDVETAELFLGFSERPIGQHRPAVSHADGGRGAGRRQGCIGDVVSGALNIVCEAEVFSYLRLLL